MSQEEILKRAEWYEIAKNWPLQSTQLEQIKEAVGTINELLELRIQNQLEHIPEIQEALNALETSVDDLERSYSKLQGMGIILGLTVTVVAGLVATVVGALMK